MATIELSENGMPVGIYGVTYYTVRNRQITEQAGGDSGLSDSGVRASAERLGEDEVLVARCTSTPRGGGCIAYGSDTARRAWAAIREREAREASAS